MSKRIKKKNRKHGEKKDSDSTDYGWTEQTCKDTIRGTQTTLTQIPLKSTEFLNWWGHVIWASQARTITINYTLCQTIILKSSFIKNLCTSKFLTAYCQFFWICALSHTSESTQIHTHKASRGWGSSSSLPVMTGNAGTYASWPFSRAALTSSVPCLGPQCSATSGIVRCTMLKYAYFVCNLACTQSQ